LPYLTGEGEEELPSAGSTPEQKVVNKKVKKGLAQQLESSPEAGHEPKGPVGRPQKTSGLLPLRKDEDKPESTTRSGKTYKSKRK
jgi:hypothetical protein